MSVRVVVTITVEADTYADAERLADTIRVPDTAFEMHPAR